MFQRVCIIIICSVFCFCAVIYSPALVCMQQLAKAEMKSNIFENTSVNEQTLLLTETEYKKAIWVEEDEFIYEGILYDLIDKTINGKKISLKAIADINEGNILQNIVNNVAGNLPIHKIIIQLFELLTIYNYTSIESFQFVKQDLLQEKISVFKLIIPTSYFNTLFRPPKIS